jgi:eukaryotic-like serine/threonine-protein kinase
VIDIGSVVNGKYRLVRLLGDGGMGSVYEAEHAVLGTRVAIKVLHPELSRRTGLVERFLQEARVAAQIRSPHVVQVIDVDRTPDGHAYIVMELLGGESLARVLDQQHKLPVPLACEYAAQILEALEAAHALGVIHRDLKPENVLVTLVGARPVLKLIDFGIAKAKPVDPQQRRLTAAGMVMGTAEYMAPEQARSADQVDARADIYAVGVMLYEMIAGSRPVRGDSGEDARVIALKVERGEVVPLVQAAPDAPREIAGLVHRAMAARPELRFATAAEMRLALQSMTSGMRPPAAAPSSPGLSTGAADPRGSSPALVASGTVVGGRDSTAPVDTVRAPPVATALAPPAYASPPVYGGAARELPPAGRRGRGPIVALIALPLLVGAGVVGVLVATGTWALGTQTAPAETAGPEPVPPATTARSATTAAPAAPSAAPPEVPTLIPAQPIPAPPRPAPSGHPGPAPAGPDAGAFPFVFPTGFPSTLPAFPSALPFPAGFPTTFPSGFPTALPGWPVPSASPRASASAPTF